MECSNYQQTKHLNMRECVCLVVVTKTISNRKKEHHIHNIPIQAEEVVQCQTIVCVCVCVCDLVSRVPLLSSPVLLLMLFSFFFSCVSSSLLLLLRLPLSRCPYCLVLLVLLPLCSTPIVLLYNILPLIVFEIFSSLIFTHLRLKFTLTCYS